MRRLPVRVLIITALGALAALPSCIFGGENSFDIPSEYHAGDAAYTLLYSTLGYDAAGTKHVLIRQNDVDAEVQQGLVFNWRAINDDGKQVADGSAAYAGSAWTIPVWIADITKVDEPGEYRVVVETGGVGLATPEFRIDHYVLSQSTFLAMAIENAEDRAAPIELDYGFYDSNTIGGSTRAHAEFVVGLIEAYQARVSALSGDQRDRVRAAIERGIDYLLLVVDPGTGEVRGESAVRPYPDESPELAAGPTLRALARYAAEFRDDFPEKAERAVRRARTLEEWLMANAAELYTPALLSTVAFDFYRYSGDPRSLERAVFAARATGETYDLRTMDRHGDDTLPYAEGIYRIWKELPEDSPDRQLVIGAANRLAAQYREMVLRNPFQLVPPGVNVSGEPSTADQWDMIGQVPLAGEGEAGEIANGWFLARAVDAAYLAEIIGDEALKNVAIASVLWVAGLNPGLPAAQEVSSEPDDPRYNSASFVIGAGAQEAEPWSDWEWARSRNGATTLRGFTPQFSFEDGPAAASSIAFDGTWLYAVTAVEDRLEPGRRAPEMQAAEPLNGPHVTAAVASEEGDLLRMLVRVSSAAGNPASDAVVTVSWRGAPPADTSPDEAVRTAQCTTDSGGSCLAVLETDDLSVLRPITVAVTNVEHASGNYAPGANASSAITQLP